MLFKSWECFSRYMKCILVGVPIWFVIGILITFSPELSKVLGVTGEITGGYAILYTYIGLALGDLLSGILSQGFQSRKKVMAGFMLLTTIFMGVYLFTPGMSPSLFYGVCVFLGVGVGYWALFVTMAAEQFGTNIRATVATTSPNFVRGSVVPLTLLFRYWSESMGLVQSALCVGALTITIAFIALWRMKETFGRDLDYLEMPPSV